MLYFKSSDYESSERFVYSYSGCSVDELEKAVSDSLISLGYKHLGNGVFEKGSRTMRLLFGAFCKYFKFQIAIDSNNPELLKLEIKKASTGASGGLIGVNQIKKEMEYMKKVFQTI
ncbi:hypothetical protein [Dysgonomonas sp. BGC7]|uniref:hypothetical protein n=1 Tax=Dysgonomonas sp. BGC7 TaxID=1658008 RepID=UPI000682B337|nr:hypothetical protein [Dysgonomonas sp. BGC7]MBD8388819.1 hypothetical protein [Dysgonomonas sp. BGC7]